MPGTPMLGSELRTALRAVFRRPASSLVLIVTIALGIGATTAIFTVVDAVLLRPRPFHEPQRLANIWTLEKNGFSHPGVEREVADYWRDRGGVFSQVESYKDRSMLFSGSSEPSNVRATFVSRGFFALLGVKAAVGRTILADDVTPSAPNVAVVSSDFWRASLGSRADAIGRPIVLDGVPYLVIGVMPEWFRYPLGEVSMWLPLKPGAMKESDAKYVNLVGRIRSGITPDVAQQRIRQLTAQLESSAPRAGGWSVALFFLDKTSVNADVKKTLWVLTGAVLCLLLVACANAANVLLVRATARSRELAIRSALGATRAALVRQLVIESLVLAGIGGVAGVAIAYWGVGLLLLIVPKEMSFFTYTGITVDARVLAFATIASIVTGLLFGVGPAVRASRTRGPLVGNDRSGTATRSTSTVRGLLIVAEVAVSLVLLAGAGLFARSFMALNGVNPGFEAERLLTAELSVPASRYPTAEQRATVLAAYLDRLRTIPGVTSASLSLGLPPRSGITFAERLQAEGASNPLSTKMLTIPFTNTDTAFFSTLGIRVVRGRSFTDEDRRTTEKRAIIDTDLARALWPNADAIGRRFRLGEEDPWVTVVGVTNDVKMAGPDDALGKYAIYYPIPSQPRGSYVEFAIRTAGDPRLSIETVRRAIWSVDSQQPITSVATARERLGDALAKPRFLLTLMGVFAGVALALAVIGLYGVLSHTVAQRTREIGIRMALGAQLGAVLRAVIGHGASLTVIGVLIGLALTAAGGRVVRSLLFGVAPLDIAALAVSGLTLTAAALVASYIPARRATRVDPLVALRSD
ncbi:MAG TPA: ABC transporter permease [Gemmatimonadaceae bacterium]|nr:ABC transporter permease [Gemmatimonadaceae bacterium]